MRLARNLAANIGGSAVTIAAGIIFLPFYLILLGPEAYALIGFHTALTGIVAAMDTSFGQIINQFFSRVRGKRVEQSCTHSIFRRGENLALGGAAFTLIVIAALSGPLSNSYFTYRSISQAEIHIAIILSGASICLRWLQSYYSNVLGGLEKQIGTNLVTSVATLFQFGGGLLALELIEPSVVIFFELMLSAQLISTLVLRQLAKRQFPKSSGDTNPAPYLEILNKRGFAAQVFGTNFMGAIISQSDKFIIGAFTEMDTLGIYSFCATVASLVLKLAAPVFAVAYPRLTLLSNKGDQTDNLTTSYHIACQLVSVLVLPAACILALFSQEVLFLWSGSRELSSAVYPVLPMLAVGNALNAMAQIPYAAQLAHNWAKLAFWQNVVAVILVIPSTWLLTLSFGIKGAASAWIIINAGYCLIGVSLMHKHLLQGEFTYWLRYDLLRPLAFLAPALAPASLLDTSSFSRFETAAFLTIFSTAALTLTLIGARSVRLSAIQRISGD